MPSGRVNDVDGASGLEALERASDTVKSGQSVLLVVNSHDGTLTGLDQPLDERFDMVERIVCAPSCQMNPGELADAIEMDFSPGSAIVVEEAQWADATSLGRLQRTLTGGGPAALVTLVHRPASDELDDIEQLVAAVEADVEIERVEIEKADADAPRPELDAMSLDLISATSLITGPLAVDVAANVITADVNSTLETGQRLVRDGLLHESRGGFTATAAGRNVVEGQQARIGLIAARLADALQAANRSPGVVGSLRAEAGQAELAFPLLRDAAFAAAERNANREAYRLAARALDLADEAGAGQSHEVGSLHLLCARFLRSAGRTVAAGDHAERAASLVGPEERISAFRLAATIADDSQRPQAAEQLISIAEFEASRSGADATLASLLAFRARVLNRIGFAIEADDTLAKAESLASGASEDVRFQIRLNKAWIHFDRGEMGRAEIEFGRLRDDAERLEGRESVADKEAWRARSLFPSGHPDEGLDAIAAAAEIASAEGVEAPLFLSDLAMAEGAVQYGRYDEALAAAERALDLVARQLPAWENMALATRARVHLAAGDLEAARVDVMRARELTPEGPNGWRWRTRCQALEIEISAVDGAHWSETAAADVADLLLQSKLYGWAAEALCVVAERTGRETAARDALALAISSGLPVIAARAAQAGGLWRDEAAAGAVLAIHAVDERVPESWQADWRRLPHVEAALNAPQPEEDPGMEAAAADLNAALARSGLSGDTTILSPSQRRSTGLVSGRPSRARRRMWAIAAALAVVVLAAGTAFGVSQLTGDEEAAPVLNTTVPPAPSTTVGQLALEETELGPPPSDDFFFGSVEHRGGPERTGYVDVQGPRAVAGYYWSLPTAGAVSASPVTFGRWVYAGTNEGTFYALDQTSGSEVWTLAPEGRISTAAAFGEADDGEGSPVVTMVVVDDDGIVRGHRADGGGGAAWSTPLGERIRSTPVIVDGLAMVATSEGAVYGLDVVNGDLLWRFPVDDTATIGSVSADLSYSEGLLYVGTGDGLMHILDVTTEAPTEVCSFDASAPIAVNPIIVDDIVYVFTQGQSIWPLPKGECSGVVPGRLPLYATEQPVDVAPAIVGDVMYIPEDRFLYAKNLTTNEDVWRSDTVTATRPISTPPVVTQDAVYFGSEDGIVYAVDSTSGEALWQWDTGLPVRGAPAVIDGAVFIVTGDGEIYAVGE